MRCPHLHTRDGNEYGYTGSVAVSPYTEENRAAHGGITYTQTCLACGAERSVNQNQWHVEYSPWGPDAATREQRERERLDRQMQARRRRLLQAGREIARQHRVSITGVYGDIVVLLQDGETHTCRIEDIRAAAGQPDTGDGLVPYYTAVLDAVGRYPYQPQPGEARYFSVA